MTRSSRREGSGEGAAPAAPGTSRRVAPGKVTATQRLPAGRRDGGAPAPSVSAAGADGESAASVQLQADDPFALHLLPAEDVARVAAAGTQGPGSTLPHGDQLQASFGRHDLSGVRAHVGGAAADAAGQIGARAYATGSDIAFAEPPDLHTAAHEAAHFVQQRAGVQLYGGVGQAGDRYEQHADAVADAVVRGESAEPLLDQMAGAGVAAPAVQRQEGGQRSGAGAARSSDVGTAATALREAVELAELGLARRRTFPDADVVRVNAAVKALADALHTHGGKLAKTDDKALDQAMSAAYALANALTIGEHARPKLGHELRETLAGLQRLVDDPRNDEPSRTPAELIPVAADSLAKLRVARVHVAERILDYPSADLHALDQAITETSGWVTTLSGAGGTRSAQRLSRAVTDQASVLAQVIPELEGFLAQPLTESSDAVVHALVLALAHSTKRSDKARRTAELAKRTRRKQRFDAPRSVIEGSDDRVAELGQFDKREGRRAQREQDRLEGRVAQLEKRVATGGTVSGVERDELLVEAREHDYRTHVRVLELQLRDTASGLDQLDDGFTGGVNRYSNEIPELVSDLRGMARVAAAAIRGYQERVALIEAAASEIDDDAQRRGEIARDKLAALDWMAQFIADHVQNARLEKRLKDAMAAAERAQTRLFIANLLTTIAMTLAGNLAASAARGVAEGAWLARAGAAGGDAIAVGRTAKIVGTVAGAAVDVGVNSVGQKLALGDKRSFLDVMAANALTGLAVHAVQVHFVKIEHLVDDVAATASAWQKLATHGKKLAASLPELSMGMIVGAATDHAYTKARGYETPPADPDAMVSEWMAQGAAIAIGRHVAAHSQAFKTLSARLQGGARTYAHARVLAMDLDVRAAGVMRTGDIAHAQAVLAQYETLLAIERAMIANELEAAHPNRRLAEDTLEDASPRPRREAGEDADEPERLPRTEPDRDPRSPEGCATTRPPSRRASPATTRSSGTPPARRTASHSCSASCAATSRRSRSSAGSRRVTSTPAHASGVWASSARSTSSSPASTARSTGARSMASSPSGIPTRSMVIACNVRPDSASTSGSWLLGRMPRTSTLPWCSPHRATSSSRLSADCLGTRSRCLTSTSVAARSCSPRRSRRAGHKSCSSWSARRTWEPTTVAP